VSTQAQDQRGGGRSLLDRLIGVVVTLGFFAKFFAFFVSFAAYSLWFKSWQFGLGFVLLILVHELGHVFEARRQGVPVTLPTFIPGFGAFVTTRQEGVAPWRSAQNYLNFAERPVESESFYLASTHDRLREIRERFDPTDLFQANHRIQPAGSDW